MQLDLFEPYRANPEIASLEAQICKLAERVEAGRYTLWLLAHSAHEARKRRNRSRWMRWRVRCAAEANAREAFEISSRIVCHLAANANSTER